MDNNEKYELIMDREVSPPSTMGVIPFSPSFKFEASSIKQLLKSDSDFKLISFTEEEAVNGISQIYEIEVEYLDESYNIDLYVCPIKGLDLMNFGFANKVYEDEMKAAQQPEFYLETSMYFGDKPLISYHLQLKVMYAIVSDVSLVIDFSSIRLLSGKWLEMTALFSIPPSPEYLYSVHTIYDSEANPDKPIYWFHTHGLHRCKLIELEMLNITAGAEELLSLLHMTVKKILAGLPKEKEKFLIGYDGMGLYLSWLRWEEALNDFPNLSLGGVDDRMDDGEKNVHAEPSGVLFAVEDGNMVSPEIYIKALSENPIYYITDEETQRMSDLAMERFHMFKQIFEQYGPKKKGFMSKLFGGKEEESGWAFIVKLGLETDNSDKAASSKEHLWFSVLSLDYTTIEAKLTNQPYWISGLNEGDINTYPIDLLTDWLIYSPEDIYNTDTIYQLFF